VSAVVPVAIDTAAARRTAQALPAAALAPGHTAKALPLQVPGPLELPRRVLEALSLCTLSLAAARAGSFIVAGEGGRLIDGLAGKGSLAARAEDGEPLSVAAVTQGCTPAEAEAAALALQETRTALRLLLQAQVQAASHSSGTVTAHAGGHMRTLLQPSLDAAVSAHARTATPLQDTLASLRTRALRHITRLQDLGLNPQQVRSAIAAFAAVTAEAGSGPATVQQRQQHPEERASLQTPLLVAVATASAWVLGMEATDSAVQQASAAAVKFLLPRPLRRGCCARGSTAAAAHKRAYSARSGPRQVELAPLACGAANPLHRPLSLAAGRPVCTAALGPARGPSSSVRSVLGSARSSSRRSRGQLSASPSLRGLASASPACDALGEQSLAGAAGALERQRTATAKAAAAALAAAAAASARSSSRAIGIEHSPRTASGSRTRRRLGGSLARDEKEEEDAKAASRRDSKPFASRPSFVGHVLYTPRKLAVRAHS
jgi:hypothetical protein